MPSGRVHHGSLTASLWVPAGWSTANARRSSGSDRGRGSGTSPRRRGLAVATALRRNRMVDGVLTPDGPGNPPSSRPASRIRGSDAVVGAELNQRALQLTGVTVGRLNATSSTVRAANSLRRQVGPAKVSGTLPEPGVPERRDVPLAVGDPAGSGVCGRATLPRGIEQAVRHHAPCDRRSPLELLNQGGPAVGGWTHGYHRGHPLVRSGDGDDVPAGIRRCPTARCGRSRRPAGCGPRQWRRGSPAAASPTEMYWRGSPSESPKPR